MANYRRRIRKVESRSTGATGLVHNSKEWFAPSRPAYLVLEILREYTRLLSRLNRGVEAKQVERILKSRLASKQPE